MTVFNPSIQIVIVLYHGIESNFVMKMKKLSTVEVVVDLITTESDEDESRTMNI